MPVHGGEFPNKCGVCNKSFSDNGHLKRQQDIHSGELPYHCDVCTESFSTKSFLKTFPTVYWTYMQQPVMTCWPHSLLWPYRETCARAIVNLLSHLYVFLNRPFTASIVTHILCILAPFPTHGTCPVHLILLCLCCLVGLPSDETFLTYDVSVTIADFSSASHDINSYRAANLTVWLRGTVRRDYV